MAVPVLFDVDQVGVEVDVVPLQRLQFAEPQSGVEGSGEDRAVVGLEGVEERRDFLRRRDPLSLASHDGEGEVERRVDGDIAATVSASEDRAQRQDRVADAAGRKPLRGEPVGKSCSIVWLIAVSLEVPSSGRARWFSACR